jgi:hypothetical protein
VVSFINMQKQFHQPPKDVSLTSFKFLRIPISYRDGIISFEV